MFFEIILQWKWEGKKPKSLTLFHFYSYCPWPFCNLIRISSNVSYDLELWLRRRRYHSKRKSEKKG